MSAAKVPCRGCGVEILPTTARDTGGLCAPCALGRRTVREDFAAVRRQWNRLIVTSSAPAATDYAKRYASGDYEGVWNALHQLDLRKPIATAIYDDAVACVRATMRRVRANVEHLVHALTNIGYEFHQPDRAHVRPSEEDRKVLAAIKQQYGPLPLSLRLFYEEVGAVDFQQSPSQLVRDSHECEAPTSPLTTLGEEDPLVVCSVQDLMAQIAANLPRLSRRYSDPPGTERLTCCLAPDLFSKANCSGGEGYLVYLPEPAVDFPLIGMWLDEVDPYQPADQYPYMMEGGYSSEFFVSHLRSCFHAAGFRGRIAFEPEDTLRRQRPSWDVLHNIARQLLPI